MMISPPLYYQHYDRLEFPLISGEIDRERKVTRWRLGQPTTLERNLQPIEPPQIVDLVDSHGLTWRELVVRVGEGWVDVTHMHVFHPLTDSYLVRPEQDGYSANPKLDHLFK